jgi:antiviral helicase SLH1
MSRIGLPITDYVGDQTSVLDQSIRIIQASIDVLTEVGHLSSCLEMIKLLQCVKSARWPTEPPLSILPGVEPEALIKRKSKAGGDGGPAGTTLAKLTAMPSGQWSRLAKDLSVPQVQQARFLRAVSVLPNVDVAVEDIKAGSITVTLKRLNAVVEREGRVYAPRYPKPQTEGWFVVVGDLAADEIIAVKRVGWFSPSSASNAKGKGPGGGGIGVGPKPVAKAVIKLPEPGPDSEAGRRGRKLDVLVISDAYVGMEYRVPGVEVPALPAVDDDMRKSKEAAGPTAGGSKQQ